jgi:hypothetical protein
MDEDGNIVQPRQVLQVKNYTVGMEFYPLPRYISCLNFLKCSYEIGVFHLKNLQNGLMPSFIIVNKMGIPPKHEREKLYEEVKQRYAGADNAGDFLMVFAEAGDKAPEFIPVQLNSSDQRFKDLAEQIEKNIMRAHNFTSAVAGIETAGKLAGSSEINEQLDMLQNTIIAPQQKLIQDAFNRIAEVNGYAEPNLQLNRFKMFSENITGQTMSNIHVTVQNN